VPQRVGDCEAPAFAGLDQCGATRPQQIRTGALTSADDRCAHEANRAAEGVGVRRTETAFILLIAVTVALAMKVIGILLITSLMIFPAAVARPFAKTPEQMAALAAAASVAGGLLLSLRLDTAAGLSIVLALAGLFFVAAVPALLCGGGDLSGSRWVGNCQCVIKTLCLKLVGLPT
jgi:hypothetical protein